jgi:hypothetical protein
MARRMFRLKFSIAKFFASVITHAMENHRATSRGSESGKNFARKMILCRSNGEQFFCVAMQHD